VIQLTRLNNQGLTVNSDLIKFVEQAPDTVITLVTGEKILVRESVQQVLERLIEFRRMVLQNLPMTWDSSCSHLALFQGPEVKKREPEK
jgi:flagellar protein FlbD